MKSNQQRLSHPGVRATATRTGNLASRTARDFSCHSGYGRITAILLGVLICGPGARADVEMPPLREILDRIVERAALWVHEEAPYSYRKRSVQEQLDGHGNVIESVEKLYHVELIRGIPFPRLVQIEGRDLTESEIRAENERERGFRNRVTGTDPEAMVEQNEPVVTHELLTRYRFTLEGTDTINERQVWVLAFEPRSGVAMRTIQHRIMGRLAGRVWVDTEDAEVSRLEVFLTERFSLGWLGWMGSLQQCELYLERQRMPDGVWVPARQSLLLAGRRLFAPMRYRTSEESFDFAQP